MFCQKCGAELPNGSKFCSKCGNNVNNLKKDFSNIENTTTQSDSYATQTNNITLSESSNCDEQTIQPSNNQIPQSNKSLSSKRLWIIIAISISAIVIILVGLLVILTSKKKINVVDVTNMSYSEAIERLSAAGFTNISSSVDESVSEDRWVVIEQSVEPGTVIYSNSSIYLTCAKRCQLNLSIESFLTDISEEYFVTVSIDGIKTGVLENSTNYTFSNEVLSGEHSITFSGSASNSHTSIRSLSINDDTTYTCQLSYDGEAIIIGNEKPATDCIDNSDESVSLLTVVDVTKMPFSEAVVELKRTGFTNISSNIDLSITDPHWLVITQSKEAGQAINSNSNIHLTCTNTSHFYLELQSVNNSGANAYAITVLLDGSFIGTIENGETFTYLLDVSNDDHVIEFCNSTNNDIHVLAEISINGNTSYSCKLIKNDNSIDITDEAVEANVDKVSIEVIDVTGLTFDDAKTKLTTCGFTNVKEALTNDISEGTEKDWVVTAQSPVAGSSVVSIEPIRLECTTFSDYVSNCYNGKNINEIVALAEKSGFGLKFQDSSWNEIDIDSLDELVRPDWIAVAAKQLKGADKTAIVTIVYIGTPTPTPTPIPTATPTPTSTPTPTPSPTPKPTSKPTPKPTSVPKPTNTPSSSNSANYHSSNNRDIAKNGDSGVYAYKNRGGNYDIYWIIDFDEGYVYYFTDGNGDETCDRVAIAEGDLNSYVLLTYYVDDYSWDEALCFKWANMPDHLIWQDSDGYPWDFYPTNLNSALRIRDTKEIYDY